MILIISLARMRHTRRRRDLLASLRQQAQPDSSEAALMHIGSELLLSVFAYCQTVAAMRCPEPMPLVERFILLVALAYLLSLAAGLTWYAMGLP